MNKYRCRGGLTIWTALMERGVTLPIRGGKLRIDEAGFHLEPWFTFKAVSIPWPDICFVCTTPSVKRKGAKWYTYKGEPITVDTLNGGLAFYTIMPALNDRHAVMLGRSRFVQFWLENSAGLRGLLDAGDKVHGGKGFMELRLMPRILLRPKNLLRALDLIERHSRFDLIVLDWGD